MCEITRELEFKLLSILLQAVPLGITDSLIYILYLVNNLSTTNSAPLSVGSTEKVQRENNTNSTFKRNVKGFTKNTPI